MWHPIGNMYVSELFRPKIGANDENNAQQTNLIKNEKLRIYLYLISN